MISDDYSAGGYPSRRAATEDRMDPPAAAAVGVDVELVAGPEPSRAWRVVRMILGVLGIVALVQAVIVMSVLFVLAASITSRLGAATDPAPAVTGCPFGEGECGG